MEIDQKAMGIEILIMKKMCRIKQDTFLDKSILAHIIFNILDRSNDKNLKRKSSTAKNRIYYTDFFDRLKKEKIIKKSGKFNRNRLHTVLEDGMFVWDGVEFDFLEVHFTTPNFPWSETDD